MFFREYLKVLTPLVFLLAAYRVIAVPLIEPATQKIEPIAAPVIHDRSAPWWSDYFKAGAWQLDKPMMAETAQGTVLLFGKLERLAGDRLRLAPLTILIPQKEEAAPQASNPPPHAKRRAIVIENPQGTEIQFRGPIDFLGGELPPVKGGQMLGEIKIYAPPKEGNPDDGMLIETRELRIDRRHIWTTGSVKMKIGQSHIDGKDLSIYLDQDLLSSKDDPPTDSESPLNGLDHLELIYVDRVHIDLPDDGLFVSKRADRMSLTPPRKAHAEVHCDGAFRFEFHESLARLSNQVELRHLVQGLPPDIFRCDELMLHFRWSKSKQASGTSAESRQISAEDWTIDQITALGRNSLDPNDPSRWVTLEAPSMNASGQGRSMKIDASHGRIALSNHLPNVPPNDSSFVYLQRDSLQVRAREIEYESERISSVKPDVTGAESPNEPRLGRLFAAGPGRAQVVSEEGDSWKLSWAKSLQLQPDGRTDRLTIDGSANASSERQGRFSADTVDLWLISLSETLIAQLESAYPGYKPASVLPERMHAAGQVNIHTAQLRANVNDMQIWFHYPEIEAAKRSATFPSPSEASTGYSLSPSAGPASNPNIAAQPRRPSEPTASPLGTAFSSLASIANRTSTGNAAEGKSSSSPLAGPGQLAASNMTLPSLANNGQSDLSAVPTLPMNVSGETLVAKLAQTSQGMFVDNLKLSGVVKVMRDQATANSPWALSITGTSLSMDSTDQGRLDATISGSPARFAIGSGALEGNEIRFNERRQMVWIDQPGVFRLPPEAMHSIAALPKTTPPSTPQPHSLATPHLIRSTPHSTDRLDWIENPEIHWQGRMVFDGRVARMDGGIRLFGRLRSDPDTIWHIDSRARQLLVELEAPISISSQPSDPAKISKIQLLEQVDIKSVQTDLKGNRRQTDHLEVPELLILVPEQRWIGTGPGSLRSRRFGNANPASPKLIQSGLMTEAPTPETRNPQAELQCLHLRFRGSMDGDMTQQRISFQNGVETLLQPILSWDENPDVLRIERLKLGQTMLTCDQLSVYNTAKLSWNQTQIANEQLRRDAAWEIVAAGQVVVETVTEQGAFAASRIARAQYAAIHSMLRIEGTAREPAIFEQIPSNPTGKQPPIRGEITTAAINLKTGEIDSAEIRSIRAELSEFAQPHPAQPGIRAAPPANNSPIPSPRLDAYPLRRQ